MGSIGHHGIIRFVEQDLSVPAHERGLYAFPATKRTEEIDLPLHDMRTSTNIAHGVEGLDVQGFTYLDCPSKLTSEEMLHGTNAEDIYVPEVIDMMLKLTGAKRGICHTVAFRRKTADKQRDPSFVVMKGSPIDEYLSKLPKDKIHANGKDASKSSEPARQVHVDMTYEGLRRSIRYARADIKEAAKHVIEAQDRKEAGEDVRVPRHASYSIWRPLETVKRDPIAVLDYRTVDPSELITSESRIGSSISPEGDYIIESYTSCPPRQPEKQKWYFVPEMKPHEVVVIKFADSAAEDDPSIAKCCAHVSPNIPGTEGEPARQSAEVRVYLFWE